MEITLETLKNRYKNLHKLFNYGSIGLYGDDGIVAYEEIGITKEYAKELLNMALDKDFDELVHYENEDEYLDDIEDEDPALLATYAPCHALMVLASLEIEIGSEKSLIDTALPKILDNFKNIDPFDDNYLFAFDYFVASVYDKNIEFINTILLDKKEDDEKRIRIFYVFEEITKWFKDKKSFEAIEEVSKKLINQNEKNAELNALALNMLLLIDAKKHIEFIRECFVRKIPIDGLYLDSLEDIEIGLGLRESKRIEENIETKKDIVKIDIPKKNLVGRNEPCPCGSGKKYKKCCIGKEL